MEDILVPIFICCVLPVAIVLVIYLARMNQDNKRAQILIKAIESGDGVNADKLAEALGKQRKSPREILNQRLLRGCIFTLVGLVIMIVGLCTDVAPIPSFTLGGILFAIGVSYVIVYFVTRKEVVASEQKSSDVQHFRE